MKLIATTCCDCNRVIGYMTPETLQLPTLCVECCFDAKNLMEEWGHHVGKREKQPGDVLRDLRYRLNRSRELANYMTEHPL